MNNKTYSERDCVYLVSSKWSAVTVDAFMIERHPLSCLHAPHHHESFYEPKLVRLLLASLGTSNSGETPLPFEPPPPPEFRPKPLPVILGGGLFLFATSVPSASRDFADELLTQCQDALRADPTIGMELGQDIETGGVYASKTATTVLQQDNTPTNIEQLVLQFQIEGGNAWAQGIAYGIRRQLSEASITSPSINSVPLVSLEVANMDASMNGTPYTVPFKTNK